MPFAAFLEKGDVEGTSVEMHDEGEGVGEGAESLQQLFFLRPVFGEILADFPAALGTKRASDQIDAGALRGKAGGLDVEKQNLFRVWEKWGKMIRFTGFYGVFYRFHVFYHSTIFDFPVVICEKK